MAKGGVKLSSSLKSMFRKLKSSSFNSNLSASSSSSRSSDDDSLQTVYVGKSRRRYLISSQLVDHPLFRGLADKSSSGDGLTVGCEVVLFEHLLWMLENADPQQPDSLQDLVEFYSC
ncbi:auxin-responsive protein SAUR50 [Cinnamomum micranthum f. kanehirae]|uniref:Auxin-responsive protein SAUR50 n=1 Tax=Cinnamomum micranthum f. kanehirae TaxID=337451 RepID=A0A3S4NNA4_9MAGN|nr:auxin-responsive protein SAUR50 [Cinnamomum micranthum f. kanehirae]